MAVAVKQTPETRAGSPFDRLAAASLAGVAYVVAMLAVAFWAVPTLWRQLGLFASGDFIGVALEGLLIFAVFIGLAILGYRLSGGLSRPGLRAGIVVGLVLLVLLALLCRWLGGLIEGWVYNNGWFIGSEAAVGGAIAGGVCLLLVLLVLRIFFKPRTEERLRGLEAQGWFTAAAYKKGQGLRVRRGTMLGVIILTVGGVWVMDQNEVLRDARDWALNIPFTGEMVVTDLGDGAGKVTSNRLRVLEPGSGDAFAEGATVNRDRAAEVVAEQARQKLAALEKLLPGLRQREQELEQLVEKATEVVRKSSLRGQHSLLKGWNEQLTAFKDRLAGEGDQLFLVQRDINQFVARAREAEQDRLRTDKDATPLKESLDKITAWASENRPPVVAPVMDRFEVRRINQGLDPNVFRFIKDATFFADLPEQYQFKAGADVHKQNFEAAVAMKEDRIKAQVKDEETRKQRLTDLRQQANAAAPPARPISGRLNYASLTLLPSVRYTLPLLLLALSLWLAWRIVNLPVFADFLIATDAELNKVSWASRRRLVQDTIVVLVTLVLMAVFLFVVDILWSQILSSDLVDVLQLPAAEKAADQGPEGLKW